MTTVGTAAAVSLDPAPAISFDHKRYGSLFFAILLYDSPRDPHFRFFDLIGIAPFIFLLIFYIFSAIGFCLICHFFIIDELCAWVRVSVYDPGELVPPTVAEITFENND